MKLKGITVGTYISKRPKGKFDESICASCENNKNKNIDKEKQYKALDTPLKKQNFEAQTRQELIAKEDALIKLRQSKEAQILNQVQTAAKSIMVTQKLDAVVSNQVIFVGGVDITDAVIQKLKETK